MSNGHQNVITSKASRDRMNTIPASLSIDGAQVFKVESTRRAQTSANFAKATSGSDPDDFQNIMADFFVKSYIYDKIFV